METVALTKPVFSQQPINKAVYEELLQHGYTSLQARVAAARLPAEGVPVTRLLRPGLAQLDDPATLKDMHKAVARLIQALNRREIIGLETDHDCDGQTSHAVLYESLIHGFGHPPEYLRSYIGHRLEEGYGLSPSLTRRIIEDPQRPTLLITADNGSGDEESIARLKACGIDTIVTDHHALPETGIPDSAHAVLNPSRPDCDYADAAIAGCMVAWLLMARTCRTLREQGKTARLPDMRHMLDFVAVGTLADCVSMAASINNRAVVRYGMQAIATQKRCCWQSLQQVRPGVVNSSYLGFTIGPLLNSDGRLADAFSSVSFLLCNLPDEATAWIDALNQQNQQRKAIQQALSEQAASAAARLVADGYSSLCIALDDGHPGVHGISASRIKDQFGRPVILFSPQQRDPQLLSGSARSIDVIHIKRVLDHINQQIPGLIQRYGGHRGAAGLTIQRQHFHTFQQAFEQAVSTRISPGDLGPRLQTDGPIAVADVTLATVTALEQLEPYGRGFEYPAFELTASIVTIRRIGHNRAHARLQLRLTDGRQVPAVWFFPHSGIERLPLNRNIVLVVRLLRGHFQGHETLDIHIVDSEVAYES